LATERWNLLHPEERPKTSRLAELLRDAPGVFTAVSDYVRAVPDALSRWFPKKPVILGTDGFGRSDDRQALRNFFEVDFRWIAFATLQALAEEGKIPKAVTIEALKTLELDPNKKNPLDD
jgi:pyruvate dehydrogenase E1 component